MFQTLQYHILHCWVLLIWRDWFLSTLLSHWVVLNGINYFHYFTLHWINLLRLYWLFKLSKLMVTLEHCLKVAWCLLAHCIIADDNHISLLLYLFSHKLFEEKKWWLTLLLTLQNCSLCSKSREGQFDGKMILTWCFPFLGRKNGIETLEEFKPRTCTIILVYSVF